MNYQAIYTEIVNLRFNSDAGKIAQVKNWVGQAEIAAWNAADWDFKRVPLANLSVTAGIATEPADLGKVRVLEDPRGDALEYLEPDIFERAFATSADFPGIADFYTVINRQILIGSTETGTFKLAYRRRYTHLNNAGQPVQGLMSADTDTPIWDSEFHYVLVPWAMILGMKLENDPSAEGLRNQRDEMLGWMMDEHLGGGVEGRVMQYGAPR